jgi:flagellar basal body rod protein FlgG
MQNALLVGLSRQVALGRELDVVANNIANINTSGFKADGSLFEEYLSSSARSDQNSGRISFVRDRGTWHDMSAGPIEQTGNPLNVAIDGSAFLSVQTARGERYTRNGALQINAQGELVTSEGDQVLGDAGPIVFQPTDNSVTIGQDGTITVRQGNSKTDSLRGSLRLVSFTDASQLRRTAAAPSRRSTARNRSRPRPRA